MADKDKDMDPLALTEELFALLQAKDYIFRAVVHALSE